MAWLVLCCYLVWILAAIRMGWESCTTLGKIESLANYAVIITAAVTGSVPLLVATIVLDSIVVLFFADYAIDPDYWSSERVKEILDELEWTPERLKNIALPLAAVMSTVVALVFYVAYQAAL